MRSSRSFRHDHSDHSRNEEGGLQYVPFRSFRLGRNFTLIAMLIIIVSLFACKDNTGAYRGKLSDRAESLSKVYKEDLDKLKAYNVQDNTTAYDEAMAAKKDLYEKFQAFVDVEPSKKMKEKKTEIKDAVDPVLVSLDKLETAMELFKNSGDVSGYKEAYEDNFKVMNEAIDKLNSIFAGMKETEQ